MDEENSTIKATASDIQQALENFRSAVGGGFSPTSSPPPRRLETLPAGLSLDAKNALLKTEGWLFEKSSPGSSSSNNNNNKNNSSSNAATLASDLCRPLDRQSYAARVATFRLAWWFAKPQRLNPLECARYGWCNSGPDMLHCKSCRKMVCLQTSDDLDLKSIETVTSKHCDMLVSTHEDTCAWKGHPSPTEFAGLPSSAAELRYGIQQRVATFAQATDDSTLLRLPTLDVESQLLTLADMSSLPEHQEVFTAQLLKEHGTTLNVQMILQFLHSLRERGKGKSTKSVEEEVEEEEEEDEEEGGGVAGLLKRRQLLLALFGWKMQALTTGSKSSLCCTVCQRSVGLWNFARNEKEESGSGSGSGSGSEENNRPKKRARVATVGKFNVLREHRWYCPLQCGHGWWTNLQAHAEALVLDMKALGGNGNAGIDGDAEGQGQGGDGCTYPDPADVLRLIQKC